MPDGWIETTLGAIGRYLNGRAFKSSEWGKSGRPIIRIQDLTGSNKNPNYYEGEVEDRYVVRPGDFLISWSATLGAYIWDGPEAVLNQHIFKVESKIDKRFHYHLVRERIAELERHAHGSGMVHVTKGVFESTPAVIPDDQKLQEAIAQAIDLADHKQASATRRLSSARRTIERFQRAVLTAACSGRLTADWREEHHPDPDEVLREWPAVTLESISTRITSGSRDWSPYYGRGSGTFVMAQNVRPGRLDWSFRQSVDPPDGDASRERSQIERGDLLVAIVGANTGDAGPVVEERPEHYVCQSVALVRPVDARLTPYLNLWFNSPQHGRRYFEECLYGAGRPHLSFSQLKSAPVAMPTLAEQDEIVRRTEALLRIANKMSARVEIAGHRVASSCQAVLAKAFRGELLSSNED